MQCFLASVKPGEHVSFKGEGIFIHLSFDFKFVYIASASYFVLERNLPMEKVCPFLLVSQDGKVGFDHHPSKASKTF